MFHNACDPHISSHPAYLAYLAQFCGWPQATIAMRAFPVLSLLGVSIVMMWKRGAMTREQRPHEWAFALTAVQHSESLDYGRGGGCDGGIMVVVKESSSASWE